MDELDRLLGEATGGNHVGSSAAPTMGNLKKVSYTHDAMIDLIIENPAIMQGDLAKAFGYTQAWVSNIIASDAFQARLAERRDELTDPSIRATIEERFKALVLRSFEIVQEKLARPAHLIPDNFALRTMELSTKALGYGASKEIVQAPQASATDHLAHLANRLIDLQSNVRKQHGEENIIEGEVVSGQVRRSEPLEGQSEERAIRADPGNPAAAA